jgi:hypothetical protein
MFSNMTTVRSKLLKQTNPGIFLPPLPIFSLNKKNGVQPINICAKFPHLVRTINLYVLRLTQHMGLGDSIVLVWGLGDSIVLVWGLGDSISMS